MLRDVLVDFAVTAMMAASLLLLITLFLDWSPV